MDFHLILELIVLFGAIFLGVRLGGMAIGYTGGLGVVVLTLLLGLKVGNIPWDVILIIMSVIAAITAMQVAGGLDYLVQLASKILRKNPKYINFLAPTVTYLLTLFAGTGHTAFSMIPVIAEVAKSQNIKPSVPLSIAVPASQIAITASPVSAAVVFMASEKALGGIGISYPLLLAIWIPTTFAGCMITAFIMNMFWKQDLSADPVYQERLSQGLVKEVSEATYAELPKGAKTSVLIFLLGVLAVVFYATAISPSVGLIKDVKLPRDGAIMSFMMVIATLIVIICKVNVDKLPTTSTFRSGMTACVCVLGVAWLGDTFVSNHTEEIKAFAGDLVKQYPALLSVALFFASMLLYSQAATAKALIPTVIVALGITAADTSSAYIIVASFAAVSALFVLPTYPTLLGAVQMDDTGTTRIGKYVFNHPFFIPGVMGIAFSVALGFLLAPILL
ncbi:MULTISPECIES: anaerobic C4-dicarboxylate transporter [unclassified Campylobacter]|uniref:anaerobic C4-dicarboxylate transporter n=1 Tax=unclassified Campylobacter TaxID=2593542 RepID=UPI0022E9E8A9|nr:MULTISPECIES: anaerobic C4-dicarboxylate transporter [unclassified Campylobacter]MDA3079843.1 anaerobic C4-dicarboxylate transporter [Campylobacter sp. CS_NA2]MDA3081397.1 anaerobic C4-dicarboxylate transporter [Campylobacter sp. CS_NA1]MDA3085944.1 anaerobic C4-dicarboxylate transporter [Campylobacter sp. CS_ED1]MDA3090677.1 anaerobic C4-dicarboxylate transporter [Campylobacter sp. CS_ED2]WBR50549.1 anaerobic C4-dicarboxylate transporter [Campylobacter sp. CS_NA3]